MNRKLKTVLSVMAALSFLCLSGCSSGNSKEIKMSGNIEIDNVPVSFRVPGLLNRRMVNEGDRVGAGTLLAELASDEFVLAAKKATAALQAEKAALLELEAGFRSEEITQAEAQLEMAKSTLRLLEKGMRPQEKASVRSALDQAIAAENKALALLNDAETDEKRFSRLYTENAVSEKDYLNAKTRAETARSSFKESQGRRKAAEEQLSLAVEGSRKEDIEKARSAVKLAEAALKLLKIGPREERIEQARAKVKVSETVLQQAQLTESFARLYSPASGTVLARYAEAGEFLKQGQPVFSVGNLDQVYLRAYISENRIGHIKPGQKVIVKTDSFPEKDFEGKIVFISSEAEFTPKTVQTDEERVKLVYRIRINIENPDELLKPGMPADAIIAR
ncbi:MAG: HlyD family efflux transporter periplasmic adaptor subunit [Candidatus Riflebacteria bacterium]